MTLRLGVALIALAGSVSCSHSPATPAGAPTAASSPSQTTATTTPPVDPFGLAPGTAKWTELTPGQCLAAPPPTDPAVVTVAVVDCAQPHAAEVFARVKIPVDAAVTGTAITQCETGFAEFTGTPSAGSPYTITYLIDSDQDRTYNNPLPSTVICLLHSAQGQPLTGSARR